MGEFRDLVGLDVRAKAYAMTVKIGLTAPEIVLHHVEIDHRAGRIQVLDKQLPYSSSMPRERPRAFSAGLVAARQWQHSQNQAAENYAARREYRERRRR